MYKHTNNTVIINDRDPIGGSICHLSYRVSAVPAIKLAKKRFLSSEENLSSDPDEKKSRICFLSLIPNRCTVLAALAVS